MFFGLRARDIATKINISEAEIRNIRHRLKLIAETKEKLPTLLEEKNHLYQVLEELHRRQTVMSQQIREIEERREQVSTLLSAEEESLKEKLTQTLIELKNQKPELFYISNEEQIGKLIVHIAELLFS